MPRTTAAPPAAAVRRLLLLKLLGTRSTHFLSHVLRAPPADAGDTDTSDASALAHAARRRMCRAAEVATCFIGAADVGRTIRVGGAMWLARSDATVGRLRRRGRAAPPLRRGRKAGSRHATFRRRRRDARRAATWAPSSAVKTRARGGVAAAQPDAAQAALGAVAEPWRAAKALPGRAIPVCTPGA